MKALKLKDIAAAVEGILLSGDGEKEITAVTTDSRQVQEGSLFVALKGERFDGNDFAADFLKGGGSAVIVSRPCEGEAVIQVEDTLRALGLLAKYYKALLAVPTVAVTGSVGKTSTKDMIASVLSRRYCVTKTQGNFNNEIGLPLTVFQMTEETERAVLEMGMNNRGEISRLVNIARPDVAVITNIGTAHIGRLGSQQGILQAKLEILERLRSDGLVILNGDDPLLWGLKGTLPFQVLYYGMENDNADLVAYDIVLGVDKSKFKVEIGGQVYTVCVNVIGEHHIYNAMAGIICGLHHKLTMEEIIEGIGAFSPSGMRQRIDKVRDMQWIVDCYNASADSMEASIVVLDKLGGAGRKVAVLGDMLEMGDYSQEAHRRVGRCVAKNGIDLLVTVGKDAQYIAEEAKGSVETVSFLDNPSAAAYLKTALQPGDTVLYKASRGMRLEEIIEAVRRNQ